MADQPWIDWTSGKNVYGVLRNAAQQVWNTSTPAFQTYSGSNWTDYDLTATEQTLGGSTGRYVLALPTLPAGVYDVTFYERANVSPSLSGDLKIGVAEIQWTGSGMSSGGGDATAANQTTIMNRIGAVTGTGDNTLLGYFKALLSKTAATPSDIGGTFAPNTDSLEAIKDGGIATVTGSVGSVTGSVGSVTGSVGSVSGGIGGNVSGSVGSIAANGITASSLAADAINATSIKADAVTKVQNGLATSTALAALAAVFEGITKLAQWLGLLAGKQAGDATARTELRATGAGSGGYDETTDSLQAIRDASFDPTATGVNAVKVGGSTIAADRMAQLYGSLRVVLAEVGSTKSAIIVADEDGILDGDDDYRGLGLECVEGVNAGIIRRISSYDGDGPLVFAFSGLPTRGDAPWPYDPAEGDKFVIIGRPG